jgi:hypothetical protein
VCLLRGSNQHLCFYTPTLNECNDFLQGCLMALEHGDVVWRCCGVKYRVGEAGGNLGEPLGAGLLELGEQCQTGLLCLVCRERWHMRILHVSWRAGCVVPMEVNGGGGHFGECFSVEVVATL